MEVPHKPDLDFEALDEANATGIPPLGGDPQNPLNNTTLDSQADTSLVQQAKKWEGEGGPKQLEREVKRLQEAKEVIEKFGTGPGGKPYFAEFKADLKKMQNEEEKKDLSLVQIES